MPLSRCFFTARNIAHTAYWEFAGPYILIWTLLSAVSTLILYYSGSVRLGRIFPWIAKWKCFKGCYSTPLMELLSWLLFLLITSPGFTQIVLGFATYYWDFSYDGFNSDGTAASFETKFIGQYGHCTMLAVIIFTVTIAFDFLRLGMFMWCFRHWIMQRTTSLFIATAGFLMFLFTFLLSTTAENYDDVMTCAPFLTLSALFLLRVVYNYFDDLGIDLNDYLYHDEISHDSIHCKGHSMRPREERWSGVMYISHCFGNLVCLFCYAFAGYWIDTRTSSPMYVYPWIQAVDLAVAFGLHNAKARHFGEVLTAFIGVVGFRIFVIYLGMQDRTSVKPGAWEFVQPVFFLLATVMGCSAVADSFWRITKNDTTEIVADDRYSQWIALERQAVVRQRNASLQGAGKVRTGLFAIGRLVGFTSDVSAKSAYDQANVVIKNETLDMLNRKAIEIGYEKERDFKQFYIDRDPYYEPTNKAGKTELRKDAEGNTVRVGEPMSEADLKLTIDRLAEHRDVRETITTNIRLMTLKKFFISYKYMVLLTIIHVCYSLFFWFTNDPIERKIWPFSQKIRATNFALLAIVIGAAAFIWTFVYGAMSNLVIMREEMDHERHSVRELLLTTSANDYQVTATKADIKHPRALSWHHHKSRERHKNGKSLKESVDLAMNEGVKKGRGMLTSEMPKVAAEAATLYALREWTAVLREWKNRATGIEDLIDFVHGPAFDETFIQSQNPPVDQKIETMFAAKYNDAKHHASQQDAEQDREEAEKIFVARAFSETIAQVAPLAVYSISRTAKTAAEENGGSIKQQIGAAIMASALAHSYFQAAGHGHTLESSKVLCRDVARRAAKDMDYKMEPQQLFDAWSEHSFMGLDRLLEIKKIGSSETRWPPIGGLNRNKIRDIFKFKEVIWQSGCGVITGASFGCVLSAFLAIVLASDTGDSTSWLGLNTKGNTRTLLVSIFFPYVVIPIVIVVQSWKRNKYHFWCESADDITLIQRLKQWRAMRRRDKANVRASSLGCMMMLGWSVTTGVFVDTEEALTVLAALIAVLTTVIPIVRATQHKRASSFLSYIFLFGSLVVVVLLVIYFLIRDDWVVPALFCLYYTLVCCYLTYDRGYMHGWKEHNILASIDKTVIFPFVGFLACLYLWYIADTDDNSDAKGYFVLGMLCTSAVLAALIYFFSLALRINQKIQDNEKKSTDRLELSMKYLELDNVDLSCEQKQKEPSTLNRQFSVSDRKALKRTNSFGFDGTDEELLVHEEEKTSWWLSEHIHEVAMFVLYILVLSAGLLAVGYYAKAKDTTYSSEHRVMYFSSLFFGLHYVIFTGLSFVLDRGAADGWHFSPSTVFPVIIPLQGELGFDFKKGVISFNKPTSCWYLGLMCIGTWGILACIMPDVDFMFGDDQMIVGVLAICVCLLSTACGPFLGGLQMNFALAKNYHHIVARAVCMTPVTDVDRIVKTCAIEYCKKSEVFKDMNLEDCEFTAEDMHMIARDSFCRCFSNDFDGNDWVAPKKYLNSNKDYKNGDIWSCDKFGEALDLLFPNSTESENEEEAKQYNLQQFFLFFRAHCLQYGTLKWDNSFLTDKRDWAIKELKTCRALYTMQADSLSESTQHKFYTPSQVRSHLTDTLYPKALSTISPCGGCTFPDSDTYSLHGSQNRRDLWSKIFDYEKYNVYLLLEKLHFEGHFALAVGYSAACMTSIDLMTNLALRANAAKLTMIDDTENQENQEGDSQANHFELPLQDFSRDIAATVYDTRIPPGKKDAEPFRDPKGGMRHVSHSVVRLRKIEYEKSLNTILTQVMRDGVAAGIGDYYSCTRLLFEFFARASTPAGMKVKFDLRPSGLGDLTIIDQQNWEAMFDNLTPTSSLYDLYMKTEALHAKWKMLCDPTSLKLEGDPKKQGGCFDNLESPIVYAASLFLEYYDVAMFVGIYSSGSTRYGIFKQACENNQTFRLYVERMCEEAKKDPVCKDSSKGLAFTQVIQSSQKIMDSLEQGCEIIFGPHCNYVLRDENNQVVFSPAGRYTDGEFDAGKIHPDMGPAVLREASMLLQAQAVYEVAFKCITSTQTNSSPLDCQGYPDTSISYQDIMQWSQCIRGYHVAQCAEDNIMGGHTKRWDDRFNFIKKDQTFSCEEFVQLHPKVSDGPKYKLGNLCVESRHWLNFEDLLDDIKDVCIMQIMDLKQCSADSASDKFDRSCTQTQNYDLVQWFSRWTATVDNMFENCFYFKNTSYLRHYNQTKNAVKEKVLGIEFERYQEELRKTFLDGTFTNIPADGSGEVKFQWKEDSIMDRANKLKLLYKGHQYLADLCCLFMATQEVRRDWSALYRVWRTIAMSRHDADIASQVAGAEADEKQSIRRHLGGVLGNDDSEENQVYLSTQMLYSNIADPSAQHSGAQLVSTDVCLHHQQEDKNGKKQTRQECAAANLSRCRGFMLLDRSTPFVRMIDPEQAKSDDKQKAAWKTLDVVRRSTGIDMDVAASDSPESDPSETVAASDSPESDPSETVQIPAKDGRKADLWVLDKMLVVTSKRQVNFNATDTKQQDTAALSTSSTDLRCIGKDDLNVTHEEAGKNMVQVSVMRASINLPFEDVTRFYPKDEAWPFVIKVTGDRFVASEKRRRFYYLATFDEADHNKLYNILCSKMRVVPLDAHTESGLQEPSSPRHERNVLMESLSRGSSAEGIPEGSNPEGNPEVEIVSSAEGIPEGSNPEGNPEVEVVPQWHDDEMELALVVAGGAQF